MRRNELPINRLVSARLTDQTRFDRAMREAAKAAIARHLREGVPLVGRVNGKLVRVPASQVAQPDPSRAA